MVQQIDALFCERKVNVLDSVVVGMHAKHLSCGVLILIAAFGGRVYAQQAGFAELRAVCNSPKRSSCSTDAQNACTKLDDISQSAGIPTDKELTALRACYGAPGARVAAEFHVTTSSRGGGIESAVIAGTGQFLINRAKAEISAFFVETLKDRMCDSNTKPYFPESCAVFAASSGETPPDLVTLGRAFRADVTKLPAKLTAAISATSPELACAIELGVDVAVALQRDGDVIGVIANATTTAYPSCGKITEFSNVVAVVKAIYDSRGSLDLLAQQRYETLIAILYGETKIATYVGKYKPILDALGELLAATGDSQSASTPAGQKRVLAASINLLKVTLAIAAPDPAMAKAVATTADIVDAAGNKDYARVAALILASFELSASLSDDAHKNLRKYIGLAAGIATANTSTDVANVLEQAAAPLGSWKRKHVKQVGVSLTGFVGATVDREDAQSPDGTTMTTGKAYAAAPFLGLGLDLHVRLSDSERIGLFAPIIDLGSVASTRFNESGGSDVLKVDDDPELGFAQVFAPGAYIYLSLGHSPAVIGGGVSYIPRLRRVDDTTNPMAPTTSTVAVTHVGVFLAVDVTVLPLL